MHFAKLLSIVIYIQVNVYCKTMVDSKSVVTSLKEPLFHDVTYILCSTLASFIPGVSGLTAELINQRRNQRVTQLLQGIVSRLDDIDKSIKTFETPACLELLEESVSQAIRAEKDFRRVILSKLMAKSINDEIVNHETDRLILSLLKDITDYELLHLLYSVRYESYELHTDYKEILNSYKDIVVLRLTDMGSNREEMDAHCIQQAHKSRLANLGLFYQDGHSHAPSYKIAKLGLLFLRRLGAISE